MRFARSHLRGTASRMLGLWLFALFVGIANACLPGQPLDVHPIAHDPAPTVPHHGQGGESPDCLKFCSDGVPLGAKVQSVQDQPGGHAFLVSAAVPHKPAVIGVHVSPTQLAHPPPAVPVYLRSLRLAL